MLFFTLFFKFLLFTKFKQGQIIKILIIYTEIILK